MDERVNCPPGFYRLVVLTNRFIAPRPPALSPHSWWTSEATCLSLPNWFFFLVTPPSSAALLLQLVDERGNFREDNFDKMRAVSGSMGFPVVVDDSNALPLGWLCQAVHMNGLLGNARA